MADKMQPEDSRTDAALAPFFDAAREGGEGPSDALMARMLGDAYDAQPDAAVPLAAVASSVVPRRRQFAGFLGGWATATALFAASAMGVAAGYVGPDLMPDLVDGALGIGVEGTADISDPLDIFAQEVAS